MIVSVGKYAQIYGVYGIGLCSRDENKVYMANQMLEWKFFFF
jgi:hypothetical protein